MMNNGERVQVKTTLDREALSSCRPQSKRGKNLVIPTGTGEISAERKGGFRP